MKRKGQQYLIKHVGNVSHYQDQRKKAKRHFRLIRNIPYRVCHYDKKLLNENIPFGDCRHKTELLIKLLKKDGIKARKILAIFDWKDLPLPKRMFKILKHGTKHLHHLVGATIEGEELYIDTTWNKELELIGFPITHQWEGNEDTTPVTTGKITYHEEKDYEKLQHQLNHHKQELRQFTKELNNLTEQAYQNYWKKKKTI